jgi:hypothetical protein
MSALYDWLASKPDPDELGYFPDGNMIGCVRGSFKNLAISTAGFGKTREEAKADLLRREAKKHERV